MKYKSQASDIESHDPGCMCVSHLIYYKEKHIQILDKLLEKLQTKDPQKDCGKEVKLPIDSTLNTNN